jgi:putative flippase GtrA
MRNQVWLKDKWLFIKQATRYLVVGGLATTLNYVLFFILYKYAGVNYLISSATGFIVSVLAGYVFNKKWTFGANNSSTKQVVKYFLVYLISLFLSVFLLKLTVDIGGIKPEYGNIISIAFTTCTNFIGLKYLVFNRQVSE